MINNSSKPENEIVSIIIRAFNVEKYIVEAIASANNQTYKPVVIIVCYDSGSTDNTLKSIIDNFIKKRDSNNIILIQHRHTSPFISLLIGLINSKGSFITFLDGDNIFPPDYVMKMYYFSKMTNNEFVYCNPVLIDKNGKLTTMRLSKIPRIYNIFYHLMQNFIDINCMFISKNCLRRILPSLYRIFRRQFFNWIYEDWFIALIALHNCKSSFVSSIYSLYRIHDTNLTFGTIKSFRKLSLKISRYYKTLLAYIIATWHTISFMQKFLLFTLLIFSPFYLIIYKLFLSKLNYK